MGRGQELLDAARLGDRDTVEKIVGQITKRSGPFTSLRKGSVNVQDDSGYTPLHRACLNGHKEIVKVLLAGEANPCMLGNKAATPLHLAAFNGNSDIVRMLLDHTTQPINIDALTTERETAFFIAVQFNKIDVVAQLLMRGADVTIRNINNESPLEVASHFGRLEIVKYLLRQKLTLVDPYRAPIHNNTIFPSTPLHRAAKMGHAEVVSALLSAGMDPNVRTQNGTPLHEAVTLDRASTVHVLLSWGANLNAKDCYGKAVYDLLAGLPEKQTRQVKGVIQKYMHMRASYDSEDDLPPFPVQDESPHAINTPKTQQLINDSFSPSSSSITNKHHPQSFVKKLASKCLGLKAKFNSAPNISNNSSIDPEVDGKKHAGTTKTNSNTLLIGNSKFFNLLSKKEESGEVVCTDEFDTRSLDRLGTLNRDSVVNRSNRSCPGFKNSLPNIAENIDAESVINTEVDCDKSKNIAEAINHKMKLEIFEPRNRMSIMSDTSAASTKLVTNECYESYEFDDNKGSNIKDLSPRPSPRATVVTKKNGDDQTIYENLQNLKPIPTPAVRTHIPGKIPPGPRENETLYENVVLIQEPKAKANIIDIDQKTPEPTKRSFLPEVVPLNSPLRNISPSVSRSSTLSSDSMVYETNLEDILLSAKSNTFRHSTTYSDSIKSNIYRTKSATSDFSDVTEASAIENVDCSYDDPNKSIYLSMTGTLPNKKSEDKNKKKELFRHKTFTNIEVDRNSVKVKDLPQWNNELLKETLPNYHIRGTGRCIYEAPTVEEFIYIFNRDSLQSNVPPFTKVLNDKRDSCYETAICFCKPRPSKHHNSAEDLLDYASHDEEETVTIDVDEFKNRCDLMASSFRCFCDSGICKLHSKRRDYLPSDFVVRFSAIKKSISTPDITLDSSPFSTAPKSNLPKNKSVPNHLEEPYAVVDLDDIITRNKSINSKIASPESPIYTVMSNPSTMSSTASRVYSIKDISEVLTMGKPSSSAATTLSRASDAVPSPILKSNSQHSGHWSLQSCNSNITIRSDASYKTCKEESSDDDTLHSDEDSDAETVKSDVSTGKRPWVHSDSFRFGVSSKTEIDAIEEMDERLESSSRFESGISLGGSLSSSSGCEEDGVPRVEGNVLEASLERAAVAGGVRSGSGRRRWEETEGMSEGDALSVSSAASSCAPLHLAHHLDYSKVSPTPPKKPPRRNLSVSPTHANSPTGYSYELRTHARSQDDLDDIQAKPYLKHGRSVDHYVDSKLSFSEYEENSSPRVLPIPNPRPSIKHRSQPVAITAMYENVAIKEQNPRRKLRRNIVPAGNYDKMADPNHERVRKYSNQERSSLESLLDDQSMNSPSDCERYSDGSRVCLPLSPTHYNQPPTPEHPPPSAKQAERSIHETIRPLSQLIMEVVEEIRIRKKSQGDISHS